MAVGIERIGGRPQDLEIALGKIMTVESLAGILEITQTDEGFEVNRPNSTNPILKYVSGESLTIKKKDGTSIKYLAFSEEDLRAHDLLEPML